MGATYTRQSSYTDGDVIQAADTNNEFDQLLAAFASSSGHTHDGTTAEGGPVMVGTSDTIDLEIQAMTGTTTGGSLRMFAILVDCTSQSATNFGANEVDRDTLA